MVAIVSGGAIHYDILRMKLAANGRRISCCVHRGLVCAEFASAGEATPGERVVESRYTSPNNYHV